MFKRLAQSIAALWAASTAAFGATLNINIYEQGPDVLLTISGTVDLTGYSNPRDLGGSIDGYIDPLNGLAIAGTGNSDVYQTTFNQYPSFGSQQPSLFATSGIGDLVGFGPTDIFVPVGYVSGFQVQGTSTFANQTLASLGLSLGTLQFTAGNTGLDVGVGTAPVPLPAAFPLPAALPLLLAGLSGLGVLARRRRAAD